MAGKDRPHRGAEPAANAVAADGPAELAGDRQADADRGVAILPRPSEEEKGGGMRPGAGLGRNEILAFSDRDDRPGRARLSVSVQADSRLRPLARRRLTTFRPALVAMRAR